MSLAQMLLGLWISYHDDEDITTLPHIEGVYDAAAEFEGRQTTLDETNEPGDRQTTLTDMDAMIGYFP